MLVALLATAPVAVAQTADTCTMPLPWGASFEPDHGGLQCWTVLQPCNGYPVEYFGYASSGTYSLAMTSSSMQETCMIATPHMAHRADSLHVSFQLTYASGDGTLEVGLMSGVFVPLLTVSTNNPRLGLYEFYTDGFASTDSLQLAFRVVNGRVAIDDVEVEVATLCRRPCQAWVDMVSVYGIVVSWDDCGGNAMQYLVRHIDTATLDTAYTTEWSTQAMLVGMTPGTTYDVAVAALCGGDTTDWFPVGLVTTEVACRQPAEASLGALTATAAGLRWSYDYGGVNAPTGMLLTLDDLNSNANTQSFNVSGDYLFVDSLFTGHNYEVTLRTLCATDTSAPISLTFMPLADACNEASGASTSQTFPMAASSQYSYSQMLYPASVLSGMDSLYALALRVVGTPILYGPRTVDVYVGQTNDSTLNTNVSTMYSLRVAQGVDVNPTEAGWTMLPFDFPIAVNDQRNVLVTIVDRTGRVGGQLRFGTHYGNFGGTIYGTSNTLEFDPGVSGMALMSSAAVADLQLFGNCTVTQCQLPAAMVIGNSPTTLTVGWTGTADSCQVLYRAVGSGGMSITAPHVDSCVLQGLNPGTLYELHVLSSCGSSPVFEGSTLCGTVAVPYHTDFTYGANLCWEGHQNTVTGGVRLGSMIISPEIAQAANTLQLRLSLDGTGYVYVGVCDAGGENLQWVDTADVYNIIGDWMVYLDGYVGTGRHIAIVGSSSMAILREVTIEQLDDCLPPRSLTVTAISGTGATLTWQGTAGHYEGILFESGTGHQISWEVDGNTMTFSGLAGNTFYNGHMYSSCGDGFSMPVTFSFTTDCESIEYFPYSESFESMTAPAQCWHLSYADPANANANPMIHTSDQSCHGQRSFRFSSYNYIQSDIYDQYLVSPRIVATDSIWLQFRYRKDNIEPEPFSVGFSTSGNSVDDFLWLGTEQAVTGQWAQYSVGLPAATRYVAIHYMGQNSYYLYIDDLTLTGPGCEAPVITLVDEQTDAVSLGWTASGDVAYVAITDGIWLSDVGGIAVTGNNYTFSNLESGHLYTAGVRSRCPDGRLSDWTIIDITTVNIHCIPPTDLAISNLDYTSAEITWQPAGVAQQWQVCLLSNGALVDIFQPVTQPYSIIDGLEQGTTYSVMVRSLMADVPGPWSDTLTFTTPQCATVGEVTYERIDFRTVRLSWQEAPVSTGHHRVEYGPAGFQRGTGMVVESTEMPLTISNLEPEPDYDFYVQNYCQPEVLSNEAAMVNVPSGLGIGNVDVAPLHLHPNPATSHLVVSGVGRGATVIVLDVAGRELQRHVATGDNMQLDLSAYPAGTYFLRVTDATRSAVGKFTVSR